LKGEYERAIADFEEALRVGRAERIFGYRLAIYNIPTFQLSSDGRVVKFSGGVNYGGARALERLLAANPSIKVIHLHSPGGVYAQAMETAKVIKTRGLDTYVSDRCESACVELFLAGRDRLLGTEGRIGFHQTSVRGVPSIDGNARVKAGFLKFGMSEPFVRRALGTKPDDIWHPSQAELLAERIPTRVVDAATFPTPVYLPPSHLKGIDFLYTFGEQHFKERRLDAAIQYFDEVIRRDPEHVLALMRRAEAFHEKGDLDRAIQDYDQASKLEPKSATILSNRGSAKLARRDIDGALADFSEAIELSPDDADINYYRGIAHVRKKAHDAAIEYFSATIIAAPDYNSALTARGESYLGKGDYDRAIADFDRALQLDPMAAETWNNRCWARVLTGRLDGALADCNESLRLKADANTFDTRAFAYFKMGEFDKAIADFDAALQRAPELASSLYGRGLAKLKKGDVEGGNADIAAGRAIRPTLDEELAKYGLKAP
jgi:tetratricopeptide (TPR) repeat protein